MVSVVTFDSPSSILSNLESFWEDQSLSDFEDSIVVRLPDFAFTSETKAPEGPLTVLNTVRGYVLTYGTSVEACKVVKSVCASITRMMHVQSVQMTVNTPMGVRLLTYDGVLTLEDVTTPDAFPAKW